MTSTNEFIKNILREVHQQRKGLKIKVEKDHKLILKVDGCHEFLEGNYQLLQYERVRYCLRKN